MLQKNPILIVEPDDTSAAITRLYLEKYGHTVCAVVADAVSGIEVAKKSRPGLILSEVSTQAVGDGIEAASIVSRMLDIPIIFITGCQEKEILRQVRAAYPVGFLSKPLRETDLKAALFLASQKPAAPCLPDMTGSDLESFSLVRDALRRTYKLTCAEANIVVAITQKPEIKYVADTLCISLATVRTHLKNIFSKTGTHKQVVLLHEVLTGPAATYFRTYRYRRAFFSKTRCR